MASRDGVIIRGEIFRCNKFLVNNCYKVIKSKHETKNCARCNNEFECKSGSILLCQCQTIVLSSKHMDYISDLYDDCLCITCLQVLRSEFNLSQYQEKINLYSH